MNKEELYRDALESIRDYCVERSFNVYCDNIGDQINNVLETADRQPEDSADQKLQCPRCGLRETMSHKCHNCEWEFDG